MSFILDALRKSDARRRMGETPGLNSTPPPGNGDSGKRRRRRGLVLIAVVLVLVLAVALVFIRPAPVSDRIQQWVGTPTDDHPAAEPGPSGADPEAGQRPEVDRERDHESRVERRIAGEGSDRDADDELTIDEGLARERIVSDPAEIDSRLARLADEQSADAPRDDEESERARRDRQQVPTPRTAVVAESPARDQRLAVDPSDTERMERLRRAREARLAEAEAGSRARSVGREPREPSASPDSPEQPSESWSPSAAGYVRVWELPLSIRRNLPDLKLSIHVFAVEEDDRFVLVNGERFGTGDMIASNVRLVEIRREGAVVDFRDYRFLLEP